MNNTKFLLVSLVILISLVILSLTVIKPLPGLTAAPRSHLPPLPGDPTPEARPSLILEIHLIDSLSGRSVTADIFTEGDLVGRNKNRYRLFFQAEQPGHLTIPLRLEAEGYHPWDKPLHFDLEHSQQFFRTIQLEPVNNP